MVPRAPRPSRLASGVPTQDGNDRRRAVTMQPPGKMGAILAPRAGWALAYRGRRRARAGGSPAGEQPRARWWPPARARAAWAPSRRAWPPLRMPSTPKTPLRRPTRTARARTYRLQGGAAWPPSLCSW
eukprot:scaffold2608_cov362-Prasinococcus_capsulatus_cf.AAC.4